MTDNLVNQMKPAGFFMLGMFTVVMAAQTMPASASSYSVIHTFAGQSAGDGDTPIPELVVGSSGRLYGTTQFGGQFGFGTIFRLTKATMGKSWTEEILYSFGQSEGNDPKGGVLIGSSGELYGTTYIGGTNNAGTVYRLDPSGGGWVLTTLHTFNPQAHDGSNAIAGLTFGANGLLYGTTEGGGTVNGGTAFSVSPLGDATEYAVLYSFGNSGDGSVPYYARPVANKKNVLFDTTSAGGATGNGIVYELAAPPPGTSNWKESILHSFGGVGSNDAAVPFQGVILGEGGVVYGCAAAGSHNQGAVYALTPPAKGSKTWTESVLYNFGDQANDPIVTECALTINSSGILFGTASGGGVNNWGAFFELDPPPNGQTAWTETILHSFGPSSSSDGLRPVSGPVRHGKTYYGVTYFGGTDGRGTVYEIKP